MCEVAAQHEHLAAIEKKHCNDDKLLECDFFGQRAGERSQESTDLKGFYSLFNFLTLSA